MLRPSPESLGICEMSKLILLFLTFAELFTAGSSGVFTPSEVQWLFAWCWGNRITPEPHWDAPREVRLEPVPASAGWAKADR